MRFLALALAKRNLAAFRVIGLNEAYEASVHVLARAYGVGMDVALRFWGPADGEAAAASRARAAFAKAGFEGLKFDAQPIVATNVFVRAASGAWKVSMHHASVVMR